MTAHTPIQMPAHWDQSLDITIEEGLRRGRKARSEAFYDAGRFIASAVNRIFARQNAAVRLMHRAKGKEPCGGCDQPSAA